MKHAAIAASFLALFSTIADAQSARDGVYIIYDSSNSMWGALPDESRKYEAARRAMNDLAGQDFGDRDIALRMYGHRRKDDCTDSELVVPWGNSGDVSAQMVSAMQKVRPTGRTPIDRSLRAALKDFGSRKGSIILVSDGIESCDADPCALVKEWRDRDIDIAVHVVGLGLTGKERDAMLCIAEAAGTQYRDAFTAEELLNGLETAVNAGLVTPGEPDPKPEETAPRFALNVITADGARQKGSAILTPVAGGDAIAVESFATHDVPPGDYTMLGGVMTLDGAVYAPVEVPVTVAETGWTYGLIEPAKRPPEVSASFVMAGEALRETVVTVWRDGEQIGSFKGDETAFVPEGTLEFRTNPAGTSQTLSVTEVFEAGAFKEIRFEPDIEVKVLLSFTFEATGERFQAYPAYIVSQKGEELAKLNRRSGGLMRPGVYQVRGDDKLNVYQTDILITDAPDQVIERALPSGALTVEYLDASGAREDPKRVFLSLAHTQRKRAVRTSDEPIGLLPGTYLVQGHPKSAGYPPVEVDILAGEAVTVTLQATQ